METKRRSGRPRKADHEKVRYQRIAVYESDYLRLMNRINARERLTNQKINLTDAFARMVDSFEI